MRSESTFALAFFSLCRSSCLSALVLVMILSGDVTGIGVGEKTPAQQTEEASREAIEAYNNGVKRLEKAKSAALKGDSAFAYNYRATSDAKARKEFDKSVEYFLSAVTLNPQFKEAYSNLGYAYRKLGKLTESLEAYDKAVALDENFTQAREYRGETYLALGKPEKATAELVVLKSLGSPYADSLARAIELFELEQLAKKIEKQ